MPDTTPLPPSASHALVLVEEQLPTTPAPGPDAHILTIVNPDEDDWTLECPFDPADTTKRCAVIYPCDCVEPGTGTPCPQDADASPHQQSRDGSSGVLDHGCWLQESDDMRDVVAALNLPVGRHLVREIGNREIPELELLRTLPPA